jgi:2-desacetyl-2-hydroxyethyl bacteriochlorophyllide A dehydrogenase
MKSKYIVFPDRQQVALWEEEIGAPGPGEALCRAEKSLISIGTELNCLRGIADPGTNWHDWLKFPFRPGYSMVGRVIEVGPGVKQVKVGDRIASYDVHQHYYRVQVEAPRVDPVYVLPDHITSEQATWRSLAVTTQNAVRRSTFQFGETAAVVGLGILGQLVVQYLALAGARRIIVVDTVESRLELAKRNGATFTLKMPVQAAVKAVEEITGGWMADVVFDVTGHPAVLASAVALVRRLGRLVLLGDTPTPGQQMLGPGVVSRSIAILGTHGYVIPDRKTEFTPWTIDEMSQVFFDYVSRGKMNVDNLVTQHVSPLDAPDIYSGLAKDRSSALGIIFDWSMLG